MRKYLFDRYARSKQSVHGSGFGLTLVKTIVDSFDGKIRVENCTKDDRLNGSKFIFAIPKY
jgi:signal transduction histidine kinase